MPNRKTLRAAVLAAFFITTAACDRQQTPEAAIQTVQAGNVEEIQVNAPERYSATIVPNLQVDLAFKSAGIVEQVLQVRGADGRIRDVGPGDKVSQGTQLAAVRPLDYQQHVDQSQAGVAQAQAQLVQAKASFVDAELDYNRARNLYGSASLTKPDLDQAQARYESAKGQVQAAQAGIQSARSQVSQATLSLDDTTLKAPFTGYVIARNVTKGSLAGNSSAAFSLIDTHVVKAVFAVPDTSLRSARLGQHVLVTLDALDHPVAGIITSVSPQADAKSRVFSVEVTIRNSNNSVRPGMIGGLSLDQSREAPSRLVIPLSAVVRAPGAANAFGIFRIDTRAGKNYALAQTVQIGSTYGNSIEVKSGLSKGERIVILGGELLRNGQEIRVLQ